MRPSLICITAQHIDNSVTIICIKPVQQALVQYKALRPISGLDQCIDSLCTHKSREAESGSNGPHSHAVTWASCRTARGPVARASAHTPSRHNQPVISWPRDVFEAVPPELTKRWDLCEKRLEWVPEENSWERGMLCSRYWDTVIHFNKCMTGFYPHKGYVCLILNTQKASFWVFMGVADILLTVKL